MEKEDTMPVFFMEESIMLEAEYEKAREEIGWKGNSVLEEERIQTLQLIFQRAWRYQERGMLDEIILGFVRKKTGIIQKAKTKGELQEISKPPRPVYCILRSLADSDAFQSGRCAEHNGRPETLAIIN